MLCPFCLNDVTFKWEKSNDAPASFYSCPDCAEQVPALYVEDYKQYPPVVVSTIGFRGHGKTTYLGALFYVLKRSGLASYWNGFFTMGLNEETLETVWNLVDMLERGELPDSTPKIFPRPAMIRVEGIPMQPNCTLLCYDTGGECFERPEQLVQHASFVQRARTAMLLVNVPDRGNPDEEMPRLLNIYIVGMVELGARTQDQHLVVVYTKADEMPDRFRNNWGEVAGYLVRGSVDGLANPREYVRDMHLLSGRLRDVFTPHQLNAEEFLNMADKHFKSVTFSMVSALGKQPDGNRISDGITPRRVLDPLLWVMEKSRSGWWRRWWG